MIIRDLKPRDLPLVGIKTLLALFPAVGLLVLAFWPRSSLSNSFYFAYISPAQWKHFILHFPFLKIPVV